MIWWKRKRSYTTFATVACDVFLFWLHAFAGRVAKDSVGGKWKGLRCVHHRLRSPWTKIHWTNLGVSENSVPLNPMVLLIIIPIKWLFHWEYTPFSDKPIWALNSRNLGSISEFLYVSIVRSDRSGRFNSHFGEFCVTDILYFMGAVPTEYELAFHISTAVKISALPWCSWMCFPNISISFLSWYRMNFSPSQIEAFARFLPCLHFAQPSVQATRVLYRQGKFVVGTSVWDNKPDSLSLPASLPANRWTVTKGLSQLSFKFFEMKWSQVSQVVQTLDFEIFFVEVPPTCCSWLRTWRHAEEPDVRNAHVAAMFAKGTEGNGNCACCHPRLGDSLVEEPYSMILGRLNSLGLIVVGWSTNPAFWSLQKDRVKISKDLSWTSLLVLQTHFDIVSLPFVPQMCPHCGVLTLWRLGFVQGARSGGFWLRLAQKFPFEMSMSILDAARSRKMCVPLWSLPKVYFFGVRCSFLELCPFFVARAGLWDMLISGMSFCVTGETLAGGGRNERWFRKSFFVTGVVFAALGRRLETFVLWNFDLVHDDDFAWQAQYLGCLMRIFLGSRGTLQTSTEKARNLGPR